MLVFNNQQRSGYEEIVSYSPRYYRSIKEMDAVFRLAGWIIDLMAQDMEDMVAFQFLKYMGDEALTRYEAFLGITKDPNKTLKERKAYISALLIGSGKISKDMIILMINQYGECDCQVKLVGSELKIGMTFKNNDDRYIDEIRRIIRAKGPVHLKYIFTVKFCYEMAAKALQKVVLKNICFVIRIPFIPFRSFGDICFYDGSARYNAKRYYILNVKFKMHCKVKTEEDFVDLTVLTRRNVQYFDGKRCYDGTTKYNAMIRKDAIE